MTVLGIETSTAVCSAGLVDDAGFSGERSLVESHIHSEKLLTMVDEICREGGVRLSQIDGVAVSLGPGSFTGLRIGLSTAKGLAFALGKPVIGVPTFEALAARVFLLHLTARRVLICVDAKQGDYFFGMYERLNEGAREVVSVQVGDIDSMQRVVRGESALLVADCPDVLGNELHCADIPLDLLSYCRGDAVADLAMKKLKAGGAASWKELEPMYLKDFVVRPRVKSALGAGVVKGD